MNNDKALASVSDKERGLDILKYSLCIDIEVLMDEYGLSREETENWLKTDNEDNQYFDGYVYSGKITKEEYFVAIDEVFRFLDR